jgi:hypothetical protein
MSFVQVKVAEEVSTPTDSTEIVAPSWFWEDIEGVLSAEWEIGGLARPADEIRALIAGE